MSGDYPQPRRARHPATPTVGVSVVTCDSPREHRQLRADEITTGRASSGVSVATCRSPREHRQLRADEITTAMGRGLPQRGGEEARS